MNSKYINKNKYVSGTSVKSQNLTMKTNSENIKLGECFAKFSISVYSSKCT